MLDAVTVDCIPSWAIVLIYSLKDRGWSSYSFLQTFDSLTSWRRSSALFSDAAMIHSRTAFLASLICLLAFPLSTCLNPRCFIARGIADDTAFVTFLPQDTRSLAHRISNSMGVHKNLS